MWPTPFLLDVYHDYKQGRLNNDEALQIVRLVESYVFLPRHLRHSHQLTEQNLCGPEPHAQKRPLPRKRTGCTTAAALIPPLSQRRRISARNQSLRDLYNFRSRSYWLRRLENHGRKERVVVEDYTIEHILPQNEDLSWKRSSVHG